MAKNPYTQDINVAVEATRKANTPSISEQLTGILTNYITKAQERAEKNVQNLQSDFVVEKQALNTKIKDYNRVIEIQNDIRDNYNGNVEAYARAQVNKQYQNDVANHYNLQGKEGFQIFDDYVDINPDKPGVQNETQDFLKSRTLNYTDRLNKIFETASNINLQEGVDSSYVDNLFTNQINQLPDSVRGKGWGVLGDLIAGQGFKLGQDYSVTRQDILDRVYSDLPSQVMGELSEQFKGLYTVDKKLAQKFREEIVPNKKVGTAVNTYSEINSATFMGQEVRFRESYMTYIDANGQQQQTEIVRTPMSEDEVFIDPETMSKFVMTYTDQAKKQWAEMAADGKSLNEIITALGKDINNFRNATVDGIKNQWAGAQNAKAVKTLYDDWTVQNGYATVEQAGFSGTTIVPVEGAKDKEGFLTFSQWRNKQINETIALMGLDDTGDDSQMGNSEPIKTEEGATISYVVGNQSYTSSTWQETVNGTNEAVVNDDGETVKFSEYTLEKLGLSNPKLLAQLEKEFKQGDFIQVDSNGLYYNPENPFILNLRELEAIGITNAVRPIEFGYDIVNEDFVMRDAKTFRDSNPELGKASFNALRMPGRYYLENAEELINSMDLESLTEGQLLTLSSANLTEELGLPKDVKLDRRATSGFSPLPDIGDFFAEPKNRKKLNLRIRDELQKRFGGDVKFMGIGQGGKGPQDAKTFMRFASSDRNEPIPSSWWADYFIGTPEGPSPKRPGQKRGTKYAPQG